MLPGNISELADKIGALEQAVQLLGSQRAAPAANIRVFMPEQAQVWSVRTRVERIIFISDPGIAINTVTLFLSPTVNAIARSGETFLFHINAGADNIFEIPFVFEPGVPLEFRPTLVDANLRVYVVSYPDE